MLLDEAVYQDDDYKGGLELGREISRLVDDDGHLNFKSAWSRSANFGLFDLLIPQKTLDSRKAVSTLEGLGQSCSQLGFLLAVGAHCFGVGAPLAKYPGPDRQRQLDDLRSGRRTAGLAATEPESGSDLMSLTTGYTREECGYVINGQKRYITNAIDGELFLVLATKDTRLNFRGVSAFLVPHDAPGVRITRMESPPGLDGCSIGALTFGNVVIPEDAMVGRPGDGLKIFETAMLWERGLITASMLGILRKQLEDTILYCKSRQQFRRPISHYQYVSGRIVDALVKYITARSLICDTAARLEGNKLSLAMAGLTKLYVSESMLNSSIDFVRNKGAHALFDQSTELSHVNSALAGVIYSGTSDVQKLIIANELGLKDT